MTELLGLLVAAAVAFAATNVDDILLLTALFGVANGNGARLRGRHIVAGQYLGVGALVALSALGAFGLLLVPEPVIGLLGLFPLALGARGLLALRRDDDENGDGAPRGGALAAGGALGVAAITVANGADNVAVYVPFFASAGAGGMVAIVAIFAVLVAAWCLVGRLAGTHPATTRAIERWGHVGVPIVLIGLGALILLEAVVGANPW